MAYTYKCDFCDATFETEDSRKPPYCPVCGAKIGEDTAASTQVQDNSIPMPVASSHPLESAAATTASAAAAAAETAAPAFNGTRPEGVPAFNGTKPEGAPQFNGTAPTAAPQTGNAYNYSGVGSAPDTNSVNGTYGTAPVNTAAETQQFAYDTNAVPTSTQSYDQTAYGTSAVPAADEMSWLMNFLSVLFPLVGFIAYFVYKKDRPKRANGVLVSAIIGLVVSFFYNTLG